MLKLFLLIDKKRTTSHHRKRAIVQMNVTTKQDSNKFKLLRSR